MKADGGRLAMEVADKVRKAAPDDLPQISTSLSRAFLTDPMFA